MSEIWKSIKDYEGLYEVSNLGRVRRLKKDKEFILKPIINKFGYLQVSLSKNNIVKNHRIHRLVAEAFISNPDNKPDVDHINTIRIDNRVENLRWVTKQENQNNELTRNHLRNNRITKIVQLDLNGKLIKIWDGAVDVEKDLGISRMSIGKCCRGEMKTYKGYIWMFYEDYNNMNDEEFNKKIGNINKNDKIKKTVQLSLDGELIKIWDKIKDCTYETNFDSSAITKCCKGKLKSHKGFKWMYYDEWLETTD